MVARVVQNPNIELYAQISVSKSHRGMYQKSYVTVQLIAIYSRFNTAVIHI